jgi:hypothetical protein
LANTVSSLVIGNTTNSADVAMNAPVNITGPMTVYGNNITLNANLTTTSAGAGAISLEANGSILTNTSGVGIRTNGSTILFAADTDNSGAGQIALDRMTMSTSGGNITLGGGALDASGYAVGANLTLANGMEPADMGVWLHSTTLNAGGGNINIRGKGGSIASGSGLFAIGVDVVSFSQNSGTGNLIQTTGSGQINITGIGGVNTDLNSHSVGINFYTDGADQRLISGSGTITLNGTAGTGPARIYAGINQDGGVVNITSTSGDVAFFGIANSTSYGISNSGTFNLGGNGTTNSTGNVTLSADTMRSGGTTNFRNTGAVTIQSYNASFSTPYVWDTSYSIVGTKTALTIGKTTNTANVSMTNAANVAGPISVYGGNISINASLNTTIANTGVILLEGTGNITQASGVSVVTNGSNVIYWANSANTTPNATITLTNVTTNGGNLWVGGANVASGNGTWHGLSVGNNGALISVNGNLTLGTGDAMLWQKAGSALTVTAGNILGGGGTIVLVSDSYSGTGLGLYTNGTINLESNSGNFGGSFNWNGTYFSANSTLVGSGSLAGLKIGNYSQSVSANLSTSLNNVVIGNYTGTGLVSDTVYSFANTGNMTITADLLTPTRVLLQSANLVLNGNVGTAPNMANITQGMTLRTTGNVTQGVNSSLYGGVQFVGGNVTLTNAGNQISGIGATSVGNLSVTSNSGSAAMGLYDISASGNIKLLNSISIIVEGNIATTSTANSTSAPALLIAAGYDQPAGNSGTMFNVNIDGYGSGPNGSFNLTMGTGGLGLIYTGNTSSWRLTDQVVSGSGHFRYNTNMSSVGYNTTAAPLTTGLYALYRASPTLTITANSSAVTYGTAPTVGSTNTALNGDTLAQIFGSVNVPTTTVTGSTSTSGNWVAGNHTIVEAGSVTNILGYATPTYVNGTLTVNQKTLTVANTTVANKIYDGTTNVTFTNNGSLVGVVSNGSLTDLVSLTTNGSFSSKNAANNIALTMADSISGTDIANYNFTQVTGITANITMRTVTLSDVQIYAGSTALTNVSIGNLAGNETLVYSAAVANSSHVAANGINFVASILLANGTGANGGLASNYQLPTMTVASANNTVTINAANLTATANGSLTKVYDGNTTANIVQSNYAVTGLVTGDSVALNNTSALYNSSHVTLANNVTVTGLTLASVSGNHSSAVSDYSLLTTGPLVFGSGGQAGTTANITVANLTVTGTTVANKTYDGSTTATLSNGTLSGAVAGDTLALTQSGNFSSKNAANSVSVIATDTFTITATPNGSLSSDYRLTQPTGITANITPRLLTLSDMQTYNGTNVMTNVTFGNLVGTETLTYTGATANSSQVAANTNNYITAITLGNQSGATTVSGGLSSNYQLPTLNVTSAPVTINAAPLGITANTTYNGLTTFANQANGTNYQLVGLVNGETITSANLVVNNANVATANNFVTGLSVVSGNATVTNYVLNSSYNNAANTNTTNILTLAAANLTVTANSTSKVYGDTVSFAGTEFTYAGNVSGQTVSAVTLSSAGAAPTASVAAAPYTIVVSNATGAGGFSTSNYNVSYVNGTVTVTQAPIGISAAGTYSGSTTVLPTSYAVTGLKNGETITNISSVSVNDANVAATSNGTQYITSIGAVTGNATLSNYQITQAYNATPSTTTTNVFTMTPASLTVTADNGAVFVGEALPGSYSVSYKGFVGGQTAANLTSAGALTIGNVINSAGAAGNTTVPSGNYTLSASGWSASNYALTYTNGTFTVSQADALLVQVGPQSTSYGTSTNSAIYGTPTVRYLANGTPTPTSLVVNATQSTGNHYVFDDGSGGTVAFNLTVVNGSYSTSSNLVAGGGYQLGSTNFNITGSNLVLTNGSTTTGSLAVNALTVTPSTNSLTKVYDGTTSMNGLAITLTPAIIAGDSVTAAGGGSFSSANAGSNIGYNVTGLALTGTDALNYVLSGGTTFGGTTGVITKAPLGISANGTYVGGTTFANLTTGTNYTLTGLVNGETINTATLTVSNGTVAGNSGNYVTGLAVVTGSGSSASMNNYQFNSVANNTLATNITNVFTVTPAPLGISANGTYNGNNTFSNQIAGTNYNLTGLVSGETLSAATLTLSNANVTSSNYVTGVAVVAGNASISNYVLNTGYSGTAGTTTTNSFAMLQAPLSVTANSTTKTYGQTSDLGTLGFTTSALVNGETVTNATMSSLGATANASVQGSPYVIQIANATGAGATSQFSAANYNISYVNGSLAVNQANLTITANGSTTQYGLGTTLGTTAFTSVGLQNSESIGSVTLASNGTAVTTNVGAYNITASSANGGTFNLANYNASYVNGTLSVTQANITVVANNQSRTYGAANPVVGNVTLTSGALYNGDTLSSADVSSIAIATTNAGNVVALSSNNQTLSAGLVSNYNVTYASGNLTIIQAPLGITANSTYNGVQAFNNLVNATSYTLTGLQNGETISVANLTVASANVGSNGANYVTSLTVAAGTANISNYVLNTAYNANAATTTSNAFTLAQRNLTITANSSNTQYGLGTTLGTTAFASSGLQNSESIGSVTLVSNGTAATNNVGAYNITASGASGGTFNIANYNASYVNGTLTVTQANITVASNDQSRIYGAANPTVGNVTLTSGTMYNGDMLSIADVSSAANATTTAGSLVTLVSSNQTLSAGAVSNYNITYVNGNLTVNAAPLTITANSTSKTYGQALTFNGTEFASSSLQNGETLSLVNLTSSGATASAAVNGGSNYTIVSSNATGANGFVSSNYNISYVTGNLTVNAAPLGISATGTYSGSTLVAPASYNVTGLVNGETINSIGSVTVNNANVNLASFVTGVNVANGTANLANYQLNTIANTTPNTSTTNTFVMAKANATVTADNAAIFAGQSLPGGYSVTTNGFVNGETAATAAGLNAGVVTNSATANSSAGIYTLTPGGWGATNYNFAYTNGTFNVVAANQLLIQTGLTTTTYGTNATIAPTSVQYMANNLTVANLTLASGGNLGNNTYIYNDPNGGTVTFTLTPTHATLSGNGSLNAYNYQMNGLVTNVTSTNFNGTTTTIGTLTVNPLTVTPSTSNVSKVYDGTTSMNGLTIGLSPAALAGDTVAVSGSGAFSQANAGSNLSYTVSGLLLSGTDAGNYVLAGGGNTFSGAHGVITPRIITLSANQVYSGSTALTNVSLGNLVGNQTIAYSGNASSKNVQDNVTNFIANLTLANGTNGGLASNYQIPTLNVTSAPVTITKLSSVTWTGGATGNWFDPANWAGGAVPDLNNVNNVIIPSGATVIFNNSIVPPAQSGPVVINSLTGATGNLTQSAGTLNVGIGGITLNTLSQSNGTLTSSGPVVLTSYNQSGGNATANSSFTTQTYDQSGGTSTLNGNLTVQTYNQSGGSSTVLGGLNATDYTQTGGSTTVTGNVTTNNMSINGGTTVALSNLNVTDILDLVNGNVTVSGNTTADTYNQSGGTSTLNGNLTVQTYNQSGGSSTVLGGLNATDYTQTGGSTTVTGNVTTNNMSINGGTTVALSNLNVTDILDLVNGNVTVSGNTTADTYNQSGGTSTLNGNLTVQTYNQIGGSSTVLGGLDATDYTQTGGSTSVAGNLSVNGSFTQTGGQADIGGTATINTSGTITLSNLNVGGGLSAASTSGSIIQTIPGTLRVKGLASFKATNGLISLSASNNFSGGNSTVDRNGNGSDNGNDNTALVTDQWIYQSTMTQGGTTLYTPLPTTQTPDTQDTYQALTFNGEVILLKKSDEESVALESDVPEIQDISVRERLVDAVDQPALTLESNEMRAIEQDGKIFLIHAGADAQPERNNKSDTLSFESGLLKEIEN